MKVKQEHCILGIGVLAVGGAIAYHFFRPGNATPQVIRDAFFNKQGYGNLMKLTPAYYNNTSTEGASDDTQSFGETYQPATWTLPAEQGNAMEVSAGWTAVPDDYAARVANTWITTANSGSHL